MARTTSTLAASTASRCRDTVADDGTYYDHVPLFAGKRVYTQAGKPGDANGAVISAIAHAGGLLAKGKLVHSYPHSWRSKAPLIFRTTPQWFISMETNELREMALKAIDDTRWVPPQGRNRIASMIENRPDWCISAPARLGRADRAVRRQEDRRAAEGHDGPRPHRRHFRDAKARTRGSPATPSSSWATATRPPITIRSSTSSTCGSNPAAPTLRAGSPARSAMAGRRSIWKARTSIAAGSIPPCWKLRHAGQGAL